jgi:hypothetical protein
MSSSFCASQNFSSRVRPYPAWGLKKAKGLLSEKIGGEKKRAAWGKFGAGHSVMP